MDELWFTPPPDDAELGVVDENGVFASVYDEDGDECYDFGNQEEVDSLPDTSIPISVSARSAFKEVREKTEQTASAITVISLLTPSYMTPTEWGEFTPWVAGHPGWTVKRREASVQDKREHGQPLMCQCFWVDAVYCKPPSPPSSVSHSNPKRKRPRATGSDLSDEQSNPSILGGNQCGDEHGGGVSVPPKTPSPPISAKNLSAPLTGPSSSDAAAATSTKQLLQARTGKEKVSAPPSGTLRQRRSLGEGNNKEAPHLTAQEEFKLLVARARGEGQAPATSTTPVALTSSSASLGTPTHRTAIAFTCSEDGEQAALTTTTRTPPTTTMTTHEAHSAGCEEKEEEEADIEGGGSLRAFPFGVEEHSAGGGGDPQAGAAAVASSASVSGATPVPHSNPTTTAAAAPTTMKVYGMKVHGMAAPAVRCTLVVERSSAAEALGLEVYAPRDETSLALGRVAVAGVSPAGAAAKAGLRVGDIIEAMHGQPLHVDPAGSALPGGGLGAALQLVQSLPPDFEVVVVRCA